MSGAQRWFAAILLLVVALACVYQQFATAQVHGGPSRAKWEYKTLKGDATDNKLDALGSEGWELVAVEPAMPYSLRSEDVRYSSRIFYFKRLK